MSSALLFSYSCACLYSIGLYLLSRTIIDELNKITHISAMDRDGSMPFLSKPSVVCFEISLLAAAEVIALFSSCFIFGSKSANFT
jgi:hypothetical protein